ncbi:MAG TPA: hypothetical protein VM029_21930 [Opitutaceae bacterium]|nr:hypothetical protein [Opitutaceae bacterium]
MKTSSFTVARRFFCASSLAVLAAIAAHAQLAPVGLPSQRALGQRTFDISAGVVHANVPDVARNGHAFSAGLNAPVSPNVDLGFNYGYGGIKVLGSGRLTDWVLSGAAVLHSGGPGAKSFVGASLGYERTKIHVGTLKENDDGGIWALSAGVEIPLGALTLTPALTYTDATNGESDSTLHWGLQANYWFTPKVAGYADVTYSDLRENGDHLWTYRVGARFKL